MYYIIAKPNRMAPVKVLASHAQSINLYIKIRATWFWPDNGSMSRNMSPNIFNFLILITNICCVIDEINVLYLYYRKTEQDGSCQSFS